MAGFNLDKSGYYAKSDNDLWVKSEFDKLSGEVNLFWQTRYRHVGATLVQVDENGRPFSSNHVRQPCYSEDPWNAAGKPTLVDRQEFLEMARGDVLGVIQGIQAHSARILALGWGQSAADVASWFEWPEKGYFIAKAPYYIVEGVGAFEGLSGMDLLDPVYGDDVFMATVSVSGKESAPFSVPTGSIVLADFLRSTLPV